MANKGNVEVCAIGMDGTHIDAETAQKILEEYGVLTGEEKQALSLKNDVVAATNNRLESVRRKAYDSFVVETNVEKYLKDAGDYKEALNRLGKDVYGRNSMDTHRRHYRAQLINKLYNFSDMYNVPKEFSLKNIEADSANEAKLHGYIKKIKFEEDTATLTPEKAMQMVKDIDDPIHRLAYAVSAYNDYTRRFLQNHGVAVERTEGFVVNRRYDSAKIDSPEFGKQDWVADMRGRIDIAKTMGEGKTEADLDEYLNNVYDMMQKKTKLKERGITNEDSMPPENRWKAKRDFVFKEDPNVDHEYEIFKKYSVGSLGDQIEENAWALSSEAVKISRLGYSATKNFDDIRGQLVKNFPSEKLNALQNVWMGRKEARIKDAAYDIAGANSYVASGLTTLSTTAKMGVALKSLGNTITVAILDPLDTSRQAFYNTGSFTESMKAFGNYQKTMLQAIHQNGVWNSVKGDFSAMQDMAERLGVVAQFISSDSSMRVARGELSTDSSMIGKIIDKHGNNLMKVATFLPQQTALSKIASSTTGALQFGKMIKKHKEGGKFTPYELDTFKEYGITEADLNILGQIEMDKVWGGAEILSGKSIRDHIIHGGDDAVAHRQKMAKVMGVGEADVNDAAFAVASKYEAYLNDFFTRGTPTPELSAKSVMGKASSSELQNVTMGLLFQFMDTPVMQFQSMVELVEKSARINKELHPEAAAFAKHMGADVMKQAVPHLMVGSMMYLAADAIWSGLMNKDSAYDKFMAGDAQTKRSVMLDVFGRTSVVPFAFEALNNATSVYRNGSILDTVSSPSLQLGADFLRTMNMNNEQATLSRFGEQLIPNAWAAQLIRNRVMEQ